MIKKLIVVTTLALSSIGIIGCTPGNNTGGATAAGAVAGGLIGSAIFGGNSQVAGIIGGALVGSVIGNQVGQYMDRQDQANMQSAIINTPVNQQASWTSSERASNGQPITYTVTPTRAYHRDNRYCREYTTVVNVGGQPKKAYGKACRMPDGTWKVVS
jgi:surface antigen